MNDESRHDRPHGLDESQLDRLLCEATKQPILLPAGLEQRIKTSVRRSVRRRRAFAFAVVTAVIAAAMTVRMTMFPADAPAPLPNIARHTPPGEDGAQRPTPAANVVTVESDDANVIAAPIETGNSAVTIVWLYPTMQTSASRPAGVSGEPIR